MSAPTDLEPIRQSLAAALSTLGDDRDHGASWLARLVARSLLDAATTAHALSSEEAPTLLALLHSAARDFAAARPSMAAVANTAARIWSAAVTLTPSADPRAALVNLGVEATHILDGERAWADAIRDNLRPLLTGPIVTLSRSGTVERALIDLVADLPDASRQITVAESRPGSEGIDTARAIAAAGWRVTLVADAAIGMGASNASLVLVGADSIRADGSVVNKVGTYPLALAACDANIPFYAACETLKIAASDFPIILEEMNPTDILPTPIPGVTARNPYFESTPARLITGIVTESGTLSPADIATESANAAEALATLLRPWPPA